MAVTPLFNDDLETLLKRARISTATNEQTLALVYQAVTEVRIGFRDRLSSSRVSTIEAYSLVDNPSTDNEYLKATAAATEATWLTYILAQRLPVLFMDNAASVGDNFNDEPLTRDAEFQNVKYLNNLKIQVDNGISMLKEPEEPSTGGLRVGTVKGRSKLYFQNGRRRT